MTASSLHALAEAAGLSVAWQDVAGADKVVDDDALRTILKALGHDADDDAVCRASLRDMVAAPSDFLVVEAGEPIAIDGPVGRVRLALEGGRPKDVRLEEKSGRAWLPAVTALGYHRLLLDERIITLAVCPPRCVTPRDLLGRRAWGLTLQLYSLRDGVSPGLGDFGALERFAEVAGRQGADALAISPVHALFLADPDRYSPYSPSSRDYLNPLLADPALVGVEPGADVDADLIDWPEAALAKTIRLRRAYRAASEDVRLAAFVQAGGMALRQHAVFEALHGHFWTKLGAADWRAWPAAWRDPKRAEEAVLALNLQDEVGFHQFVQWLADLGLARAQDAAKGAGMGLGLVADLAVGLDPGGSHAWSRPGELLAGLSLGAPPDAFQAAGQGWGITSFAPETLKRQGYAPFLRTIRQALRHAGGLRIDHALGLGRIWVIPDGAPPSQGAYLRYPLEDMLGLIALESHRAQAVVIGEDLGVVPPGLRASLASRGLLGMRVLPFEREADGAFKPAAAWDPLAAAMTSTHDLPPVAGWWRGRDIDWREHLKAPGDRDAERQARERDRDGLWRACQRDADVIGETPSSTEPAAVVDAALVLTSRTPCELALIPMEDLLGLAEQPNLPGVVDIHPNWRRRLPLPTDQLFEPAEVVARLDRLNFERPR